MLARLIRNLVSTSMRRSRHGRLQSALRHHEQAAACRKAGKLDQAEAYYRLALEADPAAPALWYNLGLLLHEVGDISAAEACYQRALELAPEDQTIHSSLLCINDFLNDIDRDEIYHRHCLWAKQFADPLTAAAPAPANILDAERRLRIGYVSADFGRHVTGRFVEPLLAHHDSMRFEVFCYNSSPVADDMTAHLRTLATHWRDVAHLADPALADLIRRDGADVLIDLHGHSLGNRLLAFARKPAPIQVTWLGYLNTTGMQCMDFRMTDAVADPIGVDGWYRERLLRLPHPQWCYVPAAGPVAGPKQPPSVRSPDQPLTFGCMTRFMKVNDAAITLWIKILTAVKGARLCMLDVPDHARGRAIQQRFAKAGLADRIDLCPTRPGDAYWESFGDVDVALDPFPYTGATSTCDCLWMGLPVISLAGQCGAARSASSLLTALGLDDLVATSTDDYLRIAVELAGNRGRIARLRRELRGRMLRSPLCDGAAFTANVEQQFIRVWHDWCSEEKRR